MSNNSIATRFAPPQKNKASLLALAVEEVVGEDQRDSLEDYFPTTGGYENWVEADSFDPIRRWVGSEHLLSVFIGPVVDEEKGIAVRLVEYIDQSWNGLFLEKGWGLFSGDKFLGEFSLSRYEPVVTVREALIARSEIRAKNRRQRREDEARQAQEAAEKTAAEAAEKAATEAQLGKFTFSSEAMAIATDDDMWNVWDRLRAILIAQSENGGFEGLPTRFLTGSLGTYLHGEHVVALREGKFQRVSKLKKGDVFYVSSARFNDLHWKGGYNVDMQDHYSFHGEELADQPKIRLINYPGNGAYVMAFEYLG